MGVNLEKMKKRAEQFEKGITDEHSAQKSIFAKLSGEKQDFRLIEMDGDVHKSFYLHYNLGKQMGFLCPKKEFNEPCPVCDWGWNLYTEAKDSKDEQLKKASQKFMPQQRWYSAVLVRGKEDDGVKLWSYAKTIAKDIVNWFSNPEYGDLTDPITGTDLTVWHEKQGGKSYPDVKCEPRRKSSPLAEPEQASKWIKEAQEIDVKENLIHLSFDEIQKVLDTVLGSPDDAPEKPASDGKPEDPVDEIDKAMAELEGK